MPCARRLLPSHGLGLGHRTGSQPPPPAPQSCHGGEVVSASHSPPRAGTAPSSPHPCPAAWHRGDRLAQSSGRAMRCPDQGPRIARALPGVWMGAGSRAGRWGSLLCPEEGESGPSSQAQQMPDRDALSLVGAEGHTLPLPSGHRVTAPASSWRSVEKPGQPGEGSRWLGKGKREKTVHPRVRTPGGHHLPGWRWGGKDPSGPTASPSPSTSGGAPPAPTLTSPQR